MVAWLLMEATDRLVNETHHKINAELMICIAFISLACNIFNLIALSPFSCLASSPKVEESLLDPNFAANTDSKSPGEAELRSGTESSDERRAAVESKQSRNLEENINIRAAVVHMLGDML